MDIKCVGFSCDRRHSLGAIRSLSHDLQFYRLQLSWRSAMEGHGPVAPPATPCRHRSVCPLQTFPDCDRRSLTDVAFQALLVPAAEKDCTMSETVAVAHCDAPPRFEPRMPGPPSSQRQSVARHLRAKTRITFPVEELEVRHGLLPSDQDHLPVPRLAMEAEFKRISGPPSTRTYSAHGREQGIDVEQGTDAVTVWLSYRVRQQMRRFCSAACRPRFPSLRR